MAPHIRGSKEESGIIKENTSSVSNKMGFLEIIRMQGIFRLLSIYFLIFLAYNVFYTAFPVHAANNLKWNAASLGLYFSILSLLLVFVEGPLLSWVSKRYSDYLLLTSGSFMLIANFVLLVYSTDFLTYVSLVFFALGNGFMWPSLMSILSKTTKKEYQGAVQGVSTSFTSLASIVGLVAGGFMFSFFGTATFVIAASILFGVFLLSLKLDSSKKEDP
jgi:MFS family permease